MVVFFWLVVISLVGSRTRVLDSFRDEMFFSEDVG